ncbi:hypothetical protein SKAU_G00325450 [Synaphobranchus kaupii]|uniref:Uncharacterized protein n=1 Tax=Synaphobranchus kaupii TaxID=118154 RepID=A0A9Q1IJZ4_SYNKA|nr:hypothetical protein SKAU_G00325450 [Synaphobranchus kaupii]
MRGQNCPFYNCLYRAYCTIQSLVQPSFAHGWYPRGRNRSWFHLLAIPLRAVESPPKNSRERLSLKEKQRGRAYFSK